MDVNGAVPDLDAIAWYSGNSGGETHRVGQKASNGWGLYDMLGIVWEWCFDGSRDYQEKSEIDPLGSRGFGAYRVSWGVPWSGTAPIVRAAFRHSSNRFYRDATIGFRCARGQ
jgi:formylglycine-generating enzyme